MCMPFDNSENMLLLLQADDNIMQHLLQQNTVSYTTFDTSLLLIKRGTY